ncbi:MAG: FAD-dependent oxidoreductase [Rhodospirillaceae bacterium]|jgi:NADPH-dependent 2,4-dienoyl-CoA reductase/sulfur reductase-like enzyme|nr:FAD-dependent oxidoreductase [Rhodospirillales bacterium]MBT4934827.1 FAD-dependent oxidoreductase [Rhodospirillaceae bacterium]MBT5244427.1 FAD-dependent oxidoreductase [Rhodospirillaceae bacterium]MBT5562263.1 FAD-dependent oxidoreductase [Rhodospirillaceae bacterium]MBT6240736.1 FAD-dependent oxidoreductase [Rhodospirillaceae bacterium]
MKDHYDIAVVGAGPAGMAAATVASEQGASVLLLDELPEAGGQIYRAVARQPIKDQKILGDDYYQGRSLVEVLANSSVEYVGGATVWQVSQEKEIGVSKDGVARLLTADQVILATGAQERPFPVPGWTLPGVMTVGGAQVLLKSSGMAVPDAVFAGTGPLLYLVAYQYLKAGISIRAILDTTPRSNLLGALPHLPAALLDIGTLMKGKRWIARLRAAGIPFIKNVKKLKLVGENSVEGVEYLHRNTWCKLDTEHVFLHQGVVPNVNMAMAAGCTHLWSDRQLCWHPLTDDWAETDVPGIAIAGDGVGIGGARAAEYRGRIAAYGALHRSGRLNKMERDHRVEPSRRALAGEMRIRPFLDAMFRPSDNFRIPEEADTIVCRCEEVSAGTIRDSIDLGCAGPNQLKSFSRCGMGPCQGRFCGLTVSEMIAQTRCVPVGEVGAFRLRPPVKPLMLAELADLAVAATTKPGLD